jgi:NADH-quinone oxidoreductase subunit L
VPFLGTPRDKRLYNHAHESPSAMTTPLWILAALSVVGGLLNLPFILTLEHWLEPALGHHEEPSLTLELLAITLSVIIATFGLVIAVARYIRNERWPVRLSDGFKGLAPVVERKWYVDEIYNAIIVTPIRLLADLFAEVIDSKIIDGIVNGVAKISGSLGERARQLQTGAIPAYALSILVGVVALVAYFVFNA